MDDKLVAIYKYMLRNEKGTLMFALCDADFAVFAYKYFKGQLRKDVIDILEESKIIRDSFKDAVYLEKLRNKKYKKGLFKRV